MYLRVLLRVSRIVLLTLLCLSVLHERYYRIQSVISDICPLFSGAVHIFVCIWDIIQMSWHSSVIKPLPLFFRGQWENRWSQGTHWIQTRKKYVRKYNRMNLCGMGIKYLAESQESISLLWRLTVSQPDVSPPYLLIRYKGGRHIYVCRLPLGRYDKL